MFVSGILAISQPKSVKMVRIESEFNSLQNKTTKNQKSWTEWQFVLTRILL